MALRAWTGRQILTCWALWLVLIAGLVAAGRLWPAGQVGWATSNATRPGLQAGPERFTEVSWDVRLGLPFFALVLAPPLLLTLLWVRLRAAEPDDA
jgi:hypothetical protein